MSDRQGASDNEPATLAELRRPKPTTSSLPKQRGARALALQKIRVVAGVTAVRSSAAVLALAFVLVIAACGGQGDEFMSLAPEDPGPIHVHALDIDPADGSLYFATHTGVWKLAEDAESAQRIAERLQDTMAFTIIGPNHFLGSGHPDLRESREHDLPPHLGLIESRDAGESWTPISLLGEADFHVLRFADGHIYGFDSTGIRLMVSTDGGKTWSARTLPRPDELVPVPDQLRDLVVHPDDPEYLVAADERSLHESRDGGRRWDIRFESSGLLAWPSPDSLYLLTPGGLVLVSSDAGRSWESVGSLEGEPVAFFAASVEELLAATDDGTIMRSIDGGASWTVRLTSDSWELQSLG